MACTRHRDTLRALKGKVNVVPGPDVPADLSLCSARQGVRIQLEAGAKFRQDLPHAGDAWRDLYNHLRNGVEGFNGYVKDEAAEALAMPGRRRMRGIAANTIAVAFLLFAANVRGIRSAVEQLDREPKAMTRKRKKRRLSDYRPRRATMPPTAA